MAATSLLVPCKTRTVLPFRQPRPSLALPCFVNGKVPACCPMSPPSSQRETCLELYGDVHVPPPATCRVPTLTSVIGEARRSQLMARWLNFNGSLGSAPSALRFLARVSPRRNWQTMPESSTRPVTQRGTRLAPAGCWQPVSSGHSARRPQKIPTSMLEAALD